MYIPPKIRKEKREIIVKTCFLFAMTFRIARIDLSRGGGVIETHAKLLGFGAKKSVFLSKQNSEICQKNNLSYSSI